MKYDHGFVERVAAMIVNKNNIDNTVQAPLSTVNRIRFPGNPSNGLLHSDHGRREGLNPLNIKKEIEISRGGADFFLPTRLETGNLRFMMAALNHPTNRGLRSGAWGGIRKHR